MESKTVQEVRNFRVVKSNELIQKSRFSLSLQEFKMISFLISKIKPSDEEFKLYEIDIKTVCKIFGIDGDNGKNHANIKDALISLKNKGFWIDLDDGNTVASASWIERVYINKRSGKVSIKLDEILRPYLVKLQEKFTQYGLFYILAMESKYSARLYELLKSYENLKHVTFWAKELRTLVGAETYKQYTDFKKRALTPAINEINSVSDINISCVEVKDGRKVEKLSFCIETVSDPVEKISKDIKALYALDGDNEMKEFETV